MRLKICVATSLLLLLALAGCGDKNSDKVQGVWRSAEKKGNRHQFVEITKDKIDIDGDVGETVLEDKDGKVAVRIAGRDEVVAVITVVDDNNIEIDFFGLFGTKLKLVKSSKEEMDAANNPPVDAILGLWRSESGDEQRGNYTIVDLKKDSLIINGQETAIGIGTKKGDYTLSVDGGVQGGVSALEARKISLSFRNTSGVFVKTTPEEVAGFAEAAQAYVKKHYGLWRSREPQGPDSQYMFVEIGEDFIGRNDEKTASRLEPSRRGVNVVIDGKDALEIELQEDDQARFHEGWSYREYVRSSPEERERIVNPKITDFKGLWVLEGDADTFRTLAIDETAIYRDGRKELFEVTAQRQNLLRVQQPGNKKFVLCWLSHADGGRIAVKHNSSFFFDMNTYRPSTREEFAKLFEGKVDFFGVMPGYWRSAEPVHADGYYATAVIEYGIQGEKASGLCDRVQHHFLDEGHRSPRNDLQPRTSEGIMGHSDGKASNPIALLTPDDSTRWWMKFAVLDANTIEITVAYDKPVKMVRSTKEEVEKLRATLRR